MLLSTPGKVLNRVLLERNEGGYRPQAQRPVGRLPAEQLLCRPDRHPAHHSGTSHWSGTPPFYINFIDYEKAFDSVDRETM